jgi:hypothetical protein
MRPGRSFFLDNTSQRDVIRKKPWHKLAIQSRSGVGGKLSKNKRIICGTARSERGHDSHRCFCRGFSADHLGVETVASAPHIAWLLPLLCLRSHPRVDRAQHSVLVCQSVRSATTHLVGPLERFRGLRRLGFRAPTLHWRLSADSRGIASVQVGEHRTPRHDRDLPLHPTSHVLFASIPGLGGGPEVRDDRYANSVCHRFCCPGCNGEGRGGRESDAVRPGVPGLHGADTPIRTLSTLSRGLTRACC